MNKGQKVLAGLLAVVAVELLPVTVVATRIVMGEVEVTYELDLAGVKKGLKKMKEEYPRHWADLVEENDDLITGDCFLQLAVFGELVYG